ncbi:MAG: dihydrolipoamide acetyltransferase family protein [Aeromicrobium sp.]
MWHKEVGESVSRGDVLFEIETDKSAMEVEAFDDGVLLARLVEDGQVVPVNSVCGYIGAAGEAIPEEPPGHEPDLPGRTVQDEPVPTAPPDASGTVSEPSSSAPSTTPETSAASGDGEGARLRISPRASRLAAEAGIDPRSIVGSGADGRIVERDVETAVAALATATAPKEPMASAAATARPIPPAPKAASGSPAAEDEAPRPLSRMRRVIAERLTSSWQTTPHFSVTVAVDVTRVLARRADLKTAGLNLTITDFILAATAQTLVEFPDVNSRTDGVSIYPRRRVHLGLAVSIPAGLVVPVIRDADRLSIGEIHDRASALAAAARDGTLAVDDMTGSTFTVSNLGMFGVEEFSAIINPGEAAILAVSSATRTPVALQDGIGVRSIMRLTLSADHRLVDGEMGARFLNALRRRLEDQAFTSADVLDS